MNKVVFLAVLAGLPGLVFAAPYGDVPDATHAWSVHDENRPLPARVTVDARGVPSDAIVLFDGTRESYEKNWCDAKGEKARWIFEEGAISCGTNFTYGECRTRQEFGDCQLHVEYRHPADITTIWNNPQMRGNSGIFLMGQKYGYEVQVLESYYSAPDLALDPAFIANYADGLAGAVYAENPPLVNPQRKPGEWQSYDIVFHQPVWKDGVLLHPGSLTVFFNGVLVQDHWEMEGETTHGYRRPLSPHPTKGPLSLQDHGCFVSFRNVWLRPLASRWDNLTCSNMSADPAKVMELRRATAAALHAKIGDVKAPTAANVLALAEVVTYSNEAKYAAEFYQALAAYKATRPTDKKELADLNYRLTALVRAHIISEEDLVR